MEDAHDARIDFSDGATRGSPYMDRAARSASVSGLATWETTLLARDINGDGTVDAFAIPRYMLRGWKLGITAVEMENLRTARLPSIRSEPGRL